MRTEEAELAITTSFLRRTLSVVGLRAQAKLLLGRLEVSSQQQRFFHQVGSRSVKIVDWEEERGVFVNNNVFSTREEVPPIRLFFERKRTGDWVSQSTHPEAPGRGLAGGRWSGLTPPTNFL